MLLAATFFKNWILVGLVPLWQGPDESVHFSYVQFMAEEKSVPVYKLPFRSYQTDNSKELAQSLRALDADHVSFNAINIQRFLYVGKWDWPVSPSPGSRRVDTENYRNNALGYSPLYYGMMAAFYQMFYSGAIEDRAYAVRIGSSLLMLPFVLFAFGIARELLNDDFSSLALAGLITFQPMLTFMFCVVNNDSLLVLSCAAFFYFIIRFIKNGDGSAAIMSGLFIGIGSLAKTSGLFLLIVWPLAILFRLFVGRRNSGGVPWAGVAAGSFLILALLLPWVYFCYANYGNLLGPSSSVVGAGQSKYPDISILERLNPLFFRWPYTLFVSFWGNFGYLDTPISENVATVLRYAYNFSFIVVIMALLKVTVSIKRITGAGFIFLFTVISIYIFDLLLSFTLYNSLAYEGGQGRYYFAVWVLMGTALFYSIQLVAPIRLARIVQSGLALAMVVYYFYSIYAVLVPRYYI